MSFKEFFSEWEMFDDGHTFVISGEDFTKEEVLEELKKAILTWPKYQAVRATVDDITEDRVRYQFAEVFGHDVEPGDHLWMLGAKGRGSKKVWVIDMWNLSNFKSSSLSGE